MGGNEMPLAHRPLGGEEGQRPVQLDSNVKVDLAIRMRLLVNDDCLDYGPAQPGPAPVGGYGVVESVADALEELASGKTRQFPQVRGRKRLWEYTRRGHQVHVALGGIGLVA